MGGGVRVLSGVAGAEAGGADDGGGVGGVRDTSLWNRNKIEDNNIGLYVCMAVVGLFAYPLVTY